MGVLGWARAWAPHLHAVEGKVGDVQLVAVHCDARRLAKLAVAISLSPDGVAPAEVGAEDDDAIVAAVAHVHRIR